MSAAEEADCARARLGLRRRITRVGGRTTRRRRFAGRRRIICRPPWAPRHLSTPWARRHRPASRGAPGLAELAAAGPAAPALEMPILGPVRWRWCAPGSISRAGCRLVAVRRRSHDQPESPAPRSASGPTDESPETMDDKPAGEGETGHGEHPGRRPAPSGLALCAPGAASTRRRGPLRTGHESIHDVAEHGAAARASGSGGGSSTAARPTFSARPRLHDLAAGPTVPGVSAQPREPVVVQSEAHRPGERLLGLPAPAVAHVPRPRLQPRPELLTRAEQQCAGRHRAEPEDFPRPGGVQSLEVVEQQRRALPGLERLEGGFEPLPCGALIWAAAPPPRTGCDGESRSQVPPAPARAVPRKPRERSGTSASRGW